MFEFFLLGITLSGTLFFLFTSPVMLTLSLISAAAFSGLLLGNMASSWLLYSIVLIFLGGMMVIFLYISSLARAEKVFFQFPALLVILLLTFFLKNLQLEAPAHSSHGSLTTLYSLFGSALIWFLVFFLILTLLIVVKLSESFKGALMYNF